MVLQMRMEVKLTNETDIRLPCQRKYVIRILPENERSVAKYEVRNKTLKAPWSIRMFKGAGARRVEVTYYISSRTRHK